MLKIENGKYIPEHLRVRYKDWDNDIRVYTDRPSLYINMCNQDPKRFGQPTVETVTLTEKQRERYNEILNLSLPENVLNSCLINASNYVEFGYFPPNVQEPLKSFAESKTEQSKQWYIKDYLSTLANIRWRKEISGAKYGEYIIASDEVSISKITGTVVSFQTGILQTTEFKFTNGWKTVDKEEMSKIAAAVTQHVNACFQAENAVKNKLQTLPFIDLFTEGKRNERRNALNLEEMFDAEFNAIINNNKQS